MFRTTSARIEAACRPLAQTQMRFKSQLHRLKHPQHIAQLVQKRKITALDPFSKQVLERNKDAVANAFPDAASFDVAALAPQRLALKSEGGAAVAPKTNKSGYGFGTDGWYHVGRTALNHIAVHSWKNSTKVKTEISKITGSAVLLKRDLCKALDLHKSDVVIAPSGRKIYVRGNMVPEVRTWLEAKF
ncbi:hypothetical protein B0I72DRAFT_139628 [Yarrowia lipolytica]|jgi:hypothetical protein|uniref:YALI0A06501p n=2 Tax=Yarrowia lipolytica TaxID=4952 RepID=Q6CHQ2_YARLI|nr:YALI0A06501p [Yarrowia lipolytica CLIB122]AOW00314.1 hypothetical protein YALI1_A06149g [Yarrowia lipolytica]KAB8280043.1 hypothetical protein BKA91DRAFT_142587 [Yarrowia lipolytica]KAE8169014.1 hypothetical protein BKA90DRAFT_143332 [Yarrowia lipolytica]KAJ8051415.1 hypothetical protein LXG23DRAFT_39124 [Yarrowia lipolytica]QNP95100.1 Hypothetical protein YALI2_A00099g [Yarrowia lipolytica]|eukprot:XP_499809.2 YALI0A06501p [Yarrowia lipolytica CLIB122]